MKLATRTANSIGTSLSLSHARTHQNITHIFRRCDVVGPLQINQIEKPHKNRTSIEVVVGEHVLFVADRLQKAVHLATDDNEQCAPCGTIIANTTNVLANE